MEFSDVLASAIHDIKNSLGMVINTVEELTSDPMSELAGSPKALTLQLEAQRANNDLIQLLTLYKLQSDRVSANVVEHNLEDFLDDVLNEHRRLAEAQGIHIEYQCDPVLSGFFDEDLVRGVLNNAIGNAARYSRNRLLIGAEREDDYTVIRVQDNGEGFPQSMLDLQTESPPSAGFGQGRTRLGLHFADKVARLHKDKDRQGFIRLENGGQLQGGCFSIWLP